jgi:hypothetical protein
VSAAAGSAEHAGEERAKQPASRHALCWIITIATGKDVTNEGIAVAVGIDELDREILLGSIDDAGSDLANMIEP